MGYIDNNLNVGEQVLLRATMSRVFGASVLSLLIGLCLFVIFWPLGLLYILGALYNMLRIRSIEIAVTDRRVIVKAGILTHIMHECPTEKINNISVVQGLGGRIFGYGNLVIQTAAEAGALKLQNVDDPFNFRKALSQAIDR